MTNLTLSATPSRRRLPYTGADFTAVVKVEAPDSGLDLATNRPPVSLVVVLDRSGSMGHRARGADTPTRRDRAITRLEAAKQTISRLVDLLGTQDSLTLITYNATATKVADYASMTAQCKSSCLRAVQDMYPSGNTDIGQALSLALREARPNSRILLFTDGWVTRGISSRAQFSTLLGAAQGTSKVSTFGFGIEHDSGLLSHISTIGEGSYHFISDTEKIASAFALEFGAAASTMLTDVALTFKLSGKVKLDGVVNPGLAVDEFLAGRSVRIKLPDLAAGAPFSVVLRLQALPRNKPLTDTHVAGIFHVEGKDRSGILRLSKPVNLRVGMVPRGQEDEKDLPEVTQAILLVTGANVLAQAQAAADTGNLSGARSMLEKYAATTKSAGATALSKAADEVLVAYASDDAYTSMGRRMSMSLGRGMSAQRAGTGVQAFDNATASSAQRQAQVMFTVKADANDDMPDVASMVTK